MSTNALEGQMKEVNKTVKTIYPSAYKYAGGINMNFHPMIITAKWSWKCFKGCHKDAI